MADWDRNIRSSDLGDDGSAFLERVMRYLDDDLPAEELAMLEDELLASEEKRRTLALICLSDSIAYEEIPPQHVQVLDADFAPTGLSMHETMEMPAIKEPPLAQEEGIILPPPAQPQITPKRRPWRLGWAAAILITGMAAGYFALSHRPAVATVTSTVTAVWETGSHRPGSTLSVDDTLFLRSGFTEVLFSDGTDVVIEAPSRFRIKAANQLDLEQGSISAKMSPGTTGFIVTTPTATVTDLGTEFGVKFDASTGLCDVDVFKGKVSVATGTGGATIRTDVTADQSARVADGAVKVDPTGASPQTFVRSLDDSGASLDLADLISGGDGTTHRTGMAIEPATGETGDLGPVREHDGDRQYHRITSPPVLDGCFIPFDGQNQIDSADHIARLSVTASSTFDRIFAGGVIPAVGGPPIYSELGGIDYSAPDHRLLFVHPNVGLTFNLDAIRRLHPSLHLSRLHAVVGNSNNGPEASRTQPLLLVLVDGAVRSQQSFKSHGDLNQLDLHLGDSDKFLTIVTLARGKTNAFQDVLLGDPILAMTSSEQNSSAGTTNE